VWDLAADGGEILALAWEPMVEGPFNILLARKPGPALPAGTRFFISGTYLSFGSPAICSIELSGAVLWDPSPDWKALRERSDAVRGHLPVLAALLAGEADKPGSAISAGGMSLDGGGWVQSCERRAESLIGQVIAAHRDGDGRALSSAVAALCGLGPGLTPAGDDWLAGWLVALWLAQDLRLDLARQAVSGAAARTTLLSAAFLDCAVEGEIDARWQLLLCALAWGTDDQVASTGRAVVGQGATSGQAMLAGFLAGIQPASASPSSAYPGCKSSHVPQTGMFSGERVRTPGYHLFLP
jgi:hypothetical protein